MYTFDHKSTHAHQVNNNHQVQNANQEGLPNIWTKPKDRNKGPLSPKRKETNHIHTHTNTAGCESGEQTHTSAPSMTNLIPL